MNPKDIAELISESPEPMNQGSVYDIINKIIKTNHDINSAADNIAALIIKFNVDSYIIISKLEASELPKERQLAKVLEYRIITT